MAQINIRIDNDLKSRADALFNELGLNMTTACIIFIRQSVRQGGIPFEITTKPELFYSDSNMRALQKSLLQAEEGNFVDKTMDELLAMEK